MNYKNELKYKVWDYQTTKMYEVETINIVCRKVEARAQKFFEKSLIISFDKRNLLQYSGFKSKDDKDIFKKDIIQFFDVTGENVRIGVVIEDEWGYLKIYAVSPVGSGYGLYHIENAVKRGIHLGSIYEFPNCIDELHWKALLEYESTLLS